MTDVVRVVILLACTIIAVFALFRTRRHVGVSGSASLTIGAFALSGVVAQASQIGIPLSIRTPFNAFAAVCGLAYVYRLAREGARKGDTIGDLVRAMLGRKRR